MYFFFLPKKMQTKFRSSTVIVRSRNVTHALCVWWPLIYFYNCIQIAWFQCDFLPSINGVYQRDMSKGSKWIHFNNNHSLFQKSNYQLAADYLEFWWMKSDCRDYTWFNQVQSGGIHILYIRIQQMERVQKGLTHHVWFLLKIMILAWHTFKYSHWKLEECTLVCVPFTQLQTILWSMLSFQPSVNWTDFVFVF